MKCLWIVVRLYRHLQHKHKTNMTSKKKNVRVHRYERTNMAYKCKKFVAVNITLLGHYTHVCTVLKVIGKNTKNMSAKQGRYNWSLMIRNKYDRYGCQMHSTYAYSASLKTYWLTCLMFIINHCIAVPLRQAPKFWMISSASSSSLLLSWSNTCYLGGHWILKYNL